MQLSLLCFKEFKTNKKPEQYIFVTILYILYKEIMLRKNHYSELVAIFRLLLKHTLLIYILLGLPFLNMFSLATCNCLLHAS